MGPEFVNCPHCGAQNPAAAFFCGECGRQVRSLLSGEDGPVEEVGGEIRLESILDDGAQEGQHYPPPEVQPAEPVMPGPSVPPAPATPPQPPDPPPVGFNQPPPQVPAGPPDPPPLNIITPPAQQPYQPPHYQQPPQQPYQPPQHQQPPQSYQQYPGGYPPGNAPGWDTGNTSGMGPNYPAPPEAGKQTCAGCIPFGIFAFLNSATTWGVVGLLGIIPGVGYILSLVYAGYIFSNGRKLAWQNRRFDSIQQFSETMESWHKWGIGCLIVNIIAAVLFVITGIATNGFEG